MLLGHIYQGFSTILSKSVLWSLSVTSNSHRYLLIMPRNIIFAISILPAVLALERTDNIGKLPALGWNSWVCVDEY